MTTLRSIAVPLAETGGLGTVAMAVYKAALRRVDLDLIPAAALPRVRWWSSHASAILRVSLTLAALGLGALAVAAAAGA